MDSNKNDMRNIDLQIAEKKERIHVLENTIYGLNADINELERLKQSYLHATVNNNGSNFPYWNAQVPPPGSFNTNININRETIKPVRQADTELEQKVLFERKIKSKKELKQLVSVFKEKKRQNFSKFNVWFWIFCVTLFIIINSLFLTWVYYMLLDQTSLVGLNDIMHKYLTEESLSYILDAALAVSIANLILLITSYAIWCSKKKQVSDYANSNYIPAFKNFFSSVFVSIIALAILLISVIMIVISAYGIYLTFNYKETNDLLWMIVELKVIAQYVPSFNDAKIIQETIFAIWLSSFFYAWIFTHQVVKKTYIIKVVKYYLLNTNWGK